MPAISVRIEDLASVPADPGLLRSGERTQLRTMRLSPQRQEEWIRGRLAIHRALSARLGRRARAQVLTRPDGAPHLVGMPYTVSLSHDGTWFAVAIAPGRSARVGVDLCHRSHAARLPSIVARLTRPDAHLDALEQWAALECVLKLRGRGITSLLGGRVALRRDGRRVRVGGIGRSTSIHLVEGSECVVAWGVEWP
jgi:phosphopantetheinyl transferase